MSVKAIRGAGKRSRKAVSPVVATVILVLISVVAGVMLWLWVSGFTSAATAQQPALYERIKIEAVQVSDNTVTIYVRNVGSVATKIDYAYVLKPDGTIIKEKGDVNTSLNPGEAKSVEVDNVSGTTSGYSYTVKVVTKNGVEASYTFVWPSS
jgi:flagellin-like protein